MRFHVFGDWLRPERVRLFARPGAMPTWLVAILGGTVGCVATALIAWSGRFFRARAEVKAHDQFAAESEACCFPRKGAVRLPTRL